MAELADIEKQTQKFSDARNALADLVGALTTAIDALKKDSLPAIKKAIHRAAEQHDRLRTMIEESPELFAKPKSKVFHGVKIGYQKSKGKIEFTDPDKVVRLIKKFFPKQADVLIQTSEKPAKDALKNLTEEELKKLGISILAGTDEVFISPVDGEVDKLVNDLLQAATEAPEEV